MSTTSSGPTVWSFFGITKALSHPERIVGYSESGPKPCLGEVG